MGKDQIIVFGIFFDESAKDFYGSLTNLVRHTFKSHFDTDPSEYQDIVAAGRTGKQVIAKDPNVNLFWRNYRPEEVDFKEEDKPGADELFVAVAFDRFMMDNRDLYSNQVHMKILNHFKDHLVSMIKERDAGK